MSNALDVLLVELLEGLRGADADPREILELGSFAVRDMGQTIAAGQVIEASARAE